MIILSLLLAAAAGPAVAHHPVHHVVHRRALRRVVRRKRHVDARLNVAGCGYSATGSCAAARSRYRLPLDQPLQPTGKADALAQTGERCGVIGQTLCTHKPRLGIHLEQ